MFKDMFKVPNYYDKFHCKGKNCRTCCCQGWNVTLSKKDYFKLMNEECSFNLKQKIETYVGILPHPRIDEFARINFDFNGNCPLRLENGFCGLQVECGEENIASVCRYYPKAPHQYPKPCCSISNSCEAILELLMDNDYTFSLEKKELSFAIDSDEQQIFPNDYLEKNKHCLSLMKEENKNIFERIFKIADYLGQPRIIFDMSILVDIYNTFKNSRSIGDYLSFSNFNSYSVEQAYISLKEIYHDLDRYLQNILLNHFLFIRFPYVSTRTSYKENSIGLYYLVCLWIYILFFNLKKKTKEEFIDITGNFFRVAEHSNLYDVITFYYHKHNNKQ